MPSQTAQAKIAAQRAANVSKLSIALAQINYYNSQILTSDMDAATLAGLGSLINSAALDVIYHAKQIAIIDTGHHPLAGA